MEARASFDGRSSTRALVVLMVAIVAALIVGGTGGYVVRALTYSVSTTTTNQVHRPFVVEQPPYQAPAPSPVLQPIYDPKGYPVPY
ncbi:MAG TPA: hypothetical protein VGX22_05500 [Candidatus Dormibacteraeota bacterium]|nr:hypothetical protein [Candidatus Dormibacteraeota bacterium]